MKYLNIDELSKALGGRSTAAIYKDVDNGQLPKPVKLGNRNYFLESEVHAHLMALRDKQQAVSA